jgi:hypothetical protein
MQADLAVAGSVTYTFPVATCGERPAVRRRGARASLNRSYLVATRRCAAPSLLHSRPHPRRVPGGWCAGDGIVTQQPSPPPPPRPQAATGKPGVAWEWFCFTNVCFVGLFAVSLWHALQHWVAHSSAAAAPATVGSKALFALSVAGGVASLLYFFAFFGVAFVYQDLDDALTPRTRKYAAAGEAAAPAAGGDGASSSGVAASGPVRGIARPEYDADVVIVGAGTAGAALATVLARDGKKVVVVER